MNGLASKVTQPKKYVPAEWEKQKALWCAFPSDPELWPDGLLETARYEVAAMLRFMADGQAVHVVASVEEASRAALDMMGDHTNIEVVPAHFGDIWLRDTGPIWSPKGALRFKTNGWGGKYIYEGDDVIGDTVAALSGKSAIMHDFVLEGGAVDHNGAGAILTTRQCLLNPNRNPQMNEAQIEQALLSAFDAERICWLDEGMLNDHTDGHVDNLARFVGENTVICQKPWGKDDPNTGLHEKTARDLRSYGFEVVQIPSPGLFHDELTGDIAPASHMNFIIGNEAVAVPTYGSDSAEEAVAEIQKLFPTRKVRGFPAISILTGGGSFHCITQQEPEL